MRQSSKGSAETAAGIIVEIVSMRWFELESCRLRHWGITAESFEFFAIFRTDDLILMALDNYSFAELSSFRGARWGY